MFTSIVEQIQGKVIVTKNPCTHPGDIRLLKAMAWDDEDPRQEHFKDLVNVVVFSSKGIRPEQNKMSGGDLDGDVYLCIWDEMLTESLDEALTEGRERNNGNDIN